VLIPDRAGDRGQMRRGVAVVVPAWRVEQEPLADRRGPFAQLGWQRRLQLELG